MNDPKDIVVTISLGKEDNSLNQTITEENKENQIITKEHRFNNLMFHLRENLSKKLYKKTIKEIDILFLKNYIEGYSRSWKLSILKVKAILKIVKHKIIKYLINHFEKIKVKHHINGIKRYLSYALDELNKFFEDNEDTNIINDEEMVDDLLYCYYDYIFLISLFHKILGNIIESISYLSFILRLNKETKLVVKSPKTINKIEKCFILLSQILICNEDYISSIEYLNIAMDICLKDIIYQAKDINDGILKEKRNQKIKNEKEIDNIKIRKSILNIVFIYFYRGVCYENLGKLKNAIRCYSQCLWFINNFYLMNNYSHFSNLIKHILKKSLEYKETIDYLHKKIRNQEYLQLKLKNQNKINLDKNEKKGSRILSKSLCSKKFKGLVNKLGKLKINEIDTVNKFEIKKNIKSLSLRKREGKDKNIFLSEIRLLNTYLREDFRVIIDDMDKIKSFDLDYSTREKIQKLVRKLYFDQNQKKLNSQKKNDQYISSRNLDNYPGKIDSKENSLQSYKFYPLTLRLSNLKKEKAKTLKSQSLIFKQSRAKSAFVRDKNTNTNLDSNNIINSQDLKKREFLKKYKRIKLNSAGALSKIEEENKVLNRFFNKKYLLKRNYIKKLEDRELTFQKNVLRLKNTPKMPIKPFNKEVVKQNVKNYYDKAMSLLLGTPINWKDNLSEEEIRNIINYNKLENAVIKSLDKNILIKFNEEKKKYRNNKKNIIVEGLNNSLSDIRNNNKNIIEKLNSKLEELRQKEIRENKNYNSLLMKNRKYLKRIKKGNLLYKANYVSNAKIKKSFSQPHLNQVKI